MNLRSFVLPESHYVGFNPVEFIVVCSTTVEPNKNAELTHIDSVLNKLVASENTKKDAEEWANVGSIYAG